MVARTSGVAAIGASVAVAARLRTTHRHAGSPLTEGVPRSRQAVTRPSHDPKGIRPRMSRSTLTLICAALCLVLAGCGGPGRGLRGREGAGRRRPGQGGRARRASDAHADAHPGAHAGAPRGRGPARRRRSLHRAAPGQRRARRASSASAPTPSSWPPSTRAAARWPWSACRATRSTCPSRPGEAYAGAHQHALLRPAAVDRQAQGGPRGAARRARLRLRDGDRPRRPGGLRRSRQAHRQHRRHRRHARRAHHRPHHAPRREGPQAEGRPAAPRRQGGAGLLALTAHRAATTTARAASSRSSRPPRRRCARRAWLRCPALVELVRKKTLTDIPMLAAPAAARAGRPRPTSRPLRSVVLEPVRWARLVPGTYTISPKVLEVQKLFDRIFDEADVGAAQRDRRPAGRPTQAVSRRGLP